MSCPCTDIIPFPQPPVNFSITNWIEIAFLDSLYKPGQRLEIIPFTHPPKRFKEIAAMFGKIISNYRIYQITDRIVEFSPDDVITPKTTFFFVNKIIQKPRQILEQRMPEMLLVRAGAAIPGSTYSTPVLNKWPSQMPSRYVTFRN